MIDTMIYAFGIILSYALFLICTLPWIFILALSLITMCANKFIDTYHNMWYLLWGIIIDIIGLFAYCSLPYILNIGNIESNTSWIVFCVSYFILHLVMVIANCFSYEMATYKGIYGTKDY
jgi:hypothetical protein